MGWPGYGAAMVWARRVFSGHGVGWSLSMSLAMSLLRSGLAMGRPCGCASHVPAIGWVGLGCLRWAVIFGLGSPGLRRSGVAMGRAWAGLAMGWDGLATVRPWAMLGWPWSGLAMS